MTIESLVELKNRIDSKKIVLFGTGGAAQKLWYWIDVIGAADDIIFCVDNNETKVGSKFLNRYNIESVDKLRDINQPTVILIASCFFTEIEKQLSEMGDFTIYNAFPNCDWELKELFELYKNKNIILVGGREQNLPLLEEFTNIFRERADISLCPESKIDDYIPEEFADSVFWIASKRHLEIEDGLVRRGFIPNTQFCTVTHLAVPDYFYLKSEIRNTGYAENLVGSKNLKEYFCPVPWVRFLLWSTETHLCCAQFANWLSMGNIQCEEGIGELWNSPMAQTFRESILNGSYYFCNEKNCWLLNSGFLYKKEEVTDPYFRKIIDEHMLIAEDGPLHMSVGFDNACNLYCKMCREANVENPNETEEKLEDILRKLKQYEFKNLKSLVVAGGGEVFFNKSYLYLLDHIGEFNMPNLKWIVIKTNGILLDQHIDLIRKLSLSYKICVSISIDSASKETYAIVRRGGAWKKLLSNLEILRSLREEGVVSYIDYSFCIQRCNVREIIPFVDFVTKYKGDSVSWQTIMGYAMSESVQSEENVYHERFSQFISDACRILRERGIIIHGEPIRKYLDEPELVPRSSSMYLNLWSNNF